MEKQALHNQCWTFEASDASLRIIRDAVRAYLNQYIADSELTENIIIAVNEACMNIVQHAYHGVQDGIIEIHISICDAMLEIIIKDNAKPVNLNAISGRDLADVRPGGLGVNFIREIMDEVIYSHRDDSEGNMVTLRKVVDC